MRWRTPQTGATRVVRRFAFLPVIAMGEIRWLEMVTIYQSYNTIKSGWNNDFFGDYLD